MAGTQRAVAPAAALAVMFNLTGTGFADQGEGEGMLTLPPPAVHGKMSVETALQKRRSERTFEAGGLTAAELSQLLWAAQGITSVNGFRTAPSAGALYPLEVYVLAGEVQGIPVGVYRYLPREHSLVQVGENDRRSALSRAALGQSCVGEGAVVLVLAGVVERTTVKYRQRGVQYVHMEVGSAAQNIYLQASSLGLGTVFVGAFDDDGVRKTVGLPASEHPFALMPVGRTGGKSGE